VRGSLTGKGLGARDRSRVNKVTKERRICEAIRRIVLIPKFATLVLVQVIAVRAETKLGWRGTAINQTQRKGEFAVRRVKVLLEGNENNQDYSVGRCFADREV